MKKPTSICLYTFDTDQSFGQKDGDARRKQALKMEGTTTTSYPSHSYQAFSTLKKAKKAAKAEYQKWYYLTKFELQMETVAALFDGLFGAMGPPCKIIKVHPLLKKET